jgi:hypothetical protein
MAKERKDPAMSRTVDVFFYGLFMDEVLLRAKGLDPQDVVIGSVPDLALRIGERAALIPAAGERTFGAVMRLPVDEVARLYNEPGLRAYTPQPVLVHLQDGSVLAALCYNLRVAPGPDEKNPEYLAKLREVAQSVGLPTDYIDRLA